MDLSLPTITNWMTSNAEHVDAILFYIFATLAIPVAFGVIFERNIIRSGFWLIGLFGAISVLFLILQAQFLAMAQIMIYAVGITLVVVIALMLTNPRMEQELSPGINQHSVGTFAIALLLFMTIYMSVRSEGWPVKSAPDLTEQPANVLVIGRALTTDYSLPFEFSSVLLLAALIGAIMLAKSEPAKSEAEYSDQTSEGTTEPAEALR
jgi:NADH:ubiquinone oxidoreductase subunit 6 (subunit J)